MQKTYPVCALVDRQLILAAARGMLRQLQSLNVLATFAVSGSDSLSVTVWDGQNVKAVEKAVQESGLGLNPMSEGNIIRIVLPILTEERRKELAKVTEYTEQCRKSIMASAKAGKN